MIQKAADANIVVSRLYKSDDPERVAEASRGLGEAMKGLEISTLGAENGGPGLLQTRGW